MTRKTWGETDNQKLSRLRLEKKSLKELSGIFNVSVNAITKALQRLKLKCCEEGIPIPKAPVEAWRQCLNAQIEKDVKELLDINDIRKSLPFQAGVILLTTLLNRNADTVKISLITGYNPTTLSKYFSRLYLAKYLDKNGEPNWNIFDSESKHFNLNLILTILVMVGDISRTEDDRYYLGDQLAMRSV